MHSGIDKSGGDEIFSKKIEECCEKLSSLKNCNNVTKRNTLKELYNIIISRDKECIERNCLYPLLEGVSKSLTFLLTDDSEKCRELSATILKDIFKTPCDLHNSIPPLLSVLSQRLGKTDEREPSEEIRLLEVDLLSSILTNFSGTNLQTSLNEITSILTNSIIDSCPDVGRKSLECVCLLENNQTTHFHIVAKSFLKPLLKTLSHHHQKTRALCVKALGSIINYLDSTEAVEAFSHLTQRLFDKVPQVRLAVTDMIGNMLVSLKDRYSYFHNLLPLMLSCLYDEVENIRSQAKVLWVEAGNQYIAENEKDYKDLIDFPKPDPVNYPDSDCRPSLGCRILVQRHIFTILPALVNDMNDWTAETRLKSTKVLYSLILHSEEKITMNLPSALKGVMISAKDSSKEVLEQAIRSAELLGYFVDSKHLFVSILSLIRNNVSSSNLSILAGVIRGQSAKLPDECLIAVCKFLSDPSASRFREAPEQANLLLCIEGLLTPENDISSVSHDIYTVLYSVSGLTKNEMILSKADELTRKLSELQSISTAELFKEHGIPLIKILIENNELWTYQSPELPIFVNIVKSGHLDEEVMELLIPAMTNNLHPGKEAKLRSKILTLLASVFQKLTPSLHDQIFETLLNLIRTGLFPNLEWAAGRTAAKLRTVAAATLFEILNRSCKRKEMLNSIGSELLSITSTLSDDDEAPTRLLSCKILEIVLPHLIGSIEDLKIHAACYEVVRCMDDESDDVRIMTLKVFRSYVESFGGDYDWKPYHAYLKHIYENVLIHMDDRNASVKEGAYGLLQDIAFAGPEILMNEITSKRFMMASSDLCDTLAKYILQMKF